MAAIEQLPQHLQAMERANYVRLKRAGFKRQVAAGAVNLAVWLRSEPPDWASGIKLYDLLAAQRRWGHMRTVKCMRRLPLSENKELGTMTERQRNAVADVLSGHRG